MNTHDVLSFAVATECVRRIRTGDAAWSHIFSTAAYPSSSRTWPLPDFVLVDDANDIKAAAEFKPPNQSKREYLTGLGQAVAYTRDFHYAILIVPDFAEDDYPIAEHITNVLAQPVATGLPISVLRYDPRVLSESNAGFIVTRPLEARTAPLARSAPVENSFWAKWRDISPMELGTFLEYLYDEGRSNEPGTVRDRAFESLWRDIQAGQLRHWGGGVRTVSDSAANKEAWKKNYRNFVAHIGWSNPDGKLTEEGLVALRIVHQYGSESRMFIDELARTILTAGKHLVLINAINRFQDREALIDNEQAWLDDLETHLEDAGLLKRNPGRHEAAIRQSARGFLKAEKTLWKNLGFISTAGTTGARVFHQGRGFIFDWSRITALLS